jgi:hypothetical protein
MKAIRIRRTLHSDTLHLPELRPLIGKTVEIFVYDITPRTAQDWEAVEKAVRELEDYDFEAYKAYREADIRHTTPPES